MLKFINKNKDKFKKTAEKQLRKNMTVIKSLRDYDTGKKDIPTSDIERRLPRIRVAP